MTEDVGLEETKRRLLGARLAFACVVVALARGEMAASGAEGMGRGREAVSFTDQKPRIATADDCCAPWSGVKNLETAECEKP